MANFFRVIKMANIFLSKWRTFSNLSKWRTFALSKRRTFFIKMANFFLSKWRISFYAYSQNGEFFAVVMKCLKGLTQKSRLFAQIQNSRLLHSKKVHFSPKSIFSGPVAVPEPSFIFKNEWYQGKFDRPWEADVSIFVTRPLLYSGSSGPGPSTFR